MITALSSDNKVYVEFDRNFLGKRIKYYLKKTNSSHGNHQPHVSTSMKDQEWKSRKMKHMI